MLSTILIMSFVKRLKTVSKRNVLSFLIITITSATLLILINYFTLRITSGIRAYINGESQYSKGQKEATRNLIMYLNTEDESYWNQFEKELNVPISDSLVRIEMDLDNDRELIKKYLLHGRNKKEDADVMIWLFVNFKNISFMRNAILIWKNADRLIGKLHGLARDSQEKINSGNLTDEHKTQIIKNINDLTLQLTVLEGAFSESLGDTARKTNKALFLINIVMTLLIIGSASAYAFVMIGRVNEKNKDLLVINHELDRFVYSASHDLRAPISSLKGLVEITRFEKNPEQVLHYLALMDKTLNKQDQFIEEIIDFSRNKKTEVVTTEVSLAKIINQAIEQHRYMPNAKTIKIESEIKLDVIKSDPLRLEIVLNNIISNAIKYSDPNKPERFIKIKTLKSNDHCLIDVTDNGMGIDKAHMPKIFEMFFVTDHNHKGSGLGLYITKETISKLKGTIKAESEWGVGTTFSIYIPLTA
jgi:signal transduction histidine kinase